MKCFKAKSPPFDLYICKSVRRLSVCQGCLGCLCFDTSLPERLHCWLASPSAVQLIVGFGPDELLPFCPGTISPSRVRHGAPIPLHSENKVQAEASAQSAQSDFAWCGRSLNCSVALKYDSAAHVVLPLPTKEKHLLRQYLRESTITWCRSLPISQQI